MGKNFSIEQSKDKISEIKRTIETKKGQLDDLKKQKEALLEARTSIESEDSNLDSSVRETIIGSINVTYEQFEQKVHDVSKDANKNLQEIEKIREDVDADIESATEEQGKLNRTQALLNKFGLGGALEKSVSNIDAHIQDAKAVQGDAVDATKGLEDVYRKLDTL